MKPVVYCSVSKLLPLQLRVPWSAVQALAAANLNLRYQISKRKLHFGSIGILFKRQQSLKTQLSVKFCSSHSRILYSSGLDRGES